MLEQALPTAGWGVFLPAHPPALVLYAALVGASAWRLARGLGGWPARVVAAGVWACALVTASAQALSLVRQLHWPGLLLVAGLGWLALRRLVPWVESSPANAAPEGGDRLALIAMALPVLAYAAFGFAIVLTATEPCADNALYHLPRLGYWLQHQSLEPFLGNNPRLGSFPPNGNVPQLVPVLFLRSDRPCGLVQLAAFFGTGLSVYGVARAFASTPLGSAGAALAWLTLPSALLQATVSMVDVTATFFTVAAGALAVSALERGADAPTSRLAGLTCLAASALAVGAKPQAALFVLPAAGLVLARGVGRVRSASLWLSPALVLVGAWPYLQNLLFFGTAAGLRSVEFVVVSAGVESLVRNAQLMFAHLAVWRGHGWEPVFVGPGLGALWLLLVPAGTAVLAARLRRGERVARRPLAFLALAAVLFLATLFTMRHQPSVTRFVLPPAGLLCVAAAFAVDAVPRPARLALALLLAAAGSVVMWRQARHDVRARLGDEGLACLAREGLRPRCLVLREPEDICGTYHRAAGRVASALGAGEPGVRIALVGSQGFPERVLLGRRFTSVLLPVSYRPDAAAFDRVGADAVWIEGSGRVPLTLFRAGFRPPAERPPASWRLESIGDSDAAFHAAVRRGVTRLDARPVVEALERRPGWVRCDASPAGVFFLRAGLPCSAGAPP